MNTIGQLCSRWLLSIAQKITYGDNCSFHMRAGTTGESKVLLRKMKPLLSILPWSAAKKMESRAEAIRTKHTRKGPDHGTGHFTSLWPTPRLAMVDLEALAVEQQRPQWPHTSTAVFA